MSDFIFLDSKITVGGDCSFLIALTIGAFVGKMMSLLFNMPSSFVMAFPGGSLFKNVPANAGEANSIKKLRRSPGEGNGNPLPYSCLRNPMDRGAWRATIYGVIKSWTQLSNWTHTHAIMIQKTNLPLLWINVFKKNHSCLLWRFLLGMPHSPPCLLPLISLSAQIHS